MGGVGVLTNLVPSPRAPLKQTEPERNLDERQNPVNLKKKSGGTYRAICEEMVIWLDKTTA